MKKILLVAILAMLFTANANAQVESPSITKQDGSIEHFDEVKLKGVGKVQGIKDGKKTEYKRTLCKGAITGKVIDGKFEVEHQYLFIKKIMKWYGSGVTMEPGNFKLRVIVKKGDNYIVSSVDMAASTGPAIAGSPGGGAERNYYLIESDQISNIVPYNVTGVGDATHYWGEEGFVELIRGHFCHCSEVKVKLGAFLAGKGKPAKQIFFFPQLEKVYLETCIEE